MVKPALNSGFVVASIQLLSAIFTSRSVVARPGNTDVIDPKTHMKDPKNIGVMPVPVISQIPILPLLGGVSVSGMELPEEVIEKNPTEFPSPCESKSSKKEYPLPPYDEVMHYLEKGSNVISLPVAWENIQTHILSDDLNKDFMEELEDVIKTITYQGGNVVLELRSSHERIRQVKPDNGAVKNSTLDDQFLDSYTKLWSNLAKSFLVNRRVIFSLASLPDNAMTPARWPKTIQAAVTAVRKTGSKNVILLPSMGNRNLSVRHNTIKTFDKTYHALKDVKNPDNTTFGLVFDLTQNFAPFDHKKHNSTTACPARNTTDYVTPLVKLLKENKRQAFIGRVVSGSHETCLSILKEFLSDIKGAYPHIAGFSMYGGGIRKEDAFGALVKKTNNSTECDSEFEDQPNFNVAKKFFPEKIVKDLDKSPLKPTS
ncbi:hypothetical protein BY996DRAFT_8493997 [Phakopsora pachyrhizi]|nr:hypothetical protein BY996DRAFT_8493997 [Phakopsora pachyrhizi]